MSLTDQERRAWRGRMADCDHKAGALVEIDGREFGICHQCFWIMPGSVARDLCYAPVHGKETEGIRI